MAGITLGKFEVGQTVKRKGGEQKGKVIETAPSRIASVRVLWGTRRTWCKPADLVQVLALAGQAAVGPGGWLLDTDAK